MKKTEKSRSVSILFRGLEILVPVESTGVVLTMRSTKELVVFRDGIHYATIRTVHTTQGNQSLTWDTKKIRRTTK